MFTYGNINIFIVYEINLCDRGYENYPVLENSLFGAVTLIKNAGIDEYKYSGYGIGFDRCKTFSMPHGSGRNVLIFGVDMSSSAHIDNKKEDILILGEGPMQGLDDTTLAAAKSIQSILFKLALQWSK